MQPRRLQGLAKWMALVAGATLGGASAAAAQTGGLDLARAVDLALANNERAPAADARHDAAEARRSRARAFFFPELLATGSYTRRAFETKRTVDGEEVTIQSRNALGATFSMSLPIFDARSIPLYRQAARDADAAGLEAREDHRLLAFEAADAFLVTIGTEQVAAAAEHRLDYASGALQDAKARFDAGLVGSNDVTRAELEAASAARALANARSLMLNARLQLGNLLDTTVEPPLVVPDELLDAAAAAAPDSAAEAPGARHRRLDLAASRTRAEALHFSAREPLMRTVPSLGFTALTRLTNEGGLSGRDSDWSVAVFGAWSLFDGGERYAERHERLALASVADLDTKALSRGVDLDVQQARVALEQEQAALQAATAAAEAARKNAAETTELYRQGLSRALEVADASVRLFEAEVAQAGERFGLGRAFLDWRAALGFDPLGRQP